MMSSKIYTFKKIKEFIGYSGLHKIYTFKKIKDFIGYSGLHMLYKPINRPSKYLFLLVSYCWRK